MTGSRRQSRRASAALLAGGLAWLLAAAATCGVGAAQKKRRGEIHSITVQETEGGTVIEVLADPPIRWSAVAAATNSLLVDLQDLRPSREVADQAFSGGLVRSIRVVDQGGGKRGGTTRLQVETSSRVAYSVGADEDRLRIELREPLPAPGADPPPPPAPATVAPPGASPRAYPSRETAYTLSPGDVLNIDVVGTSELDRTVRVFADGRIALPLLGRFPIAGLTVEAAELRIAELLRERQLLREPEVLVLVEESAAANVSVQGGVRRPGQYALAGTMTLLDVLGLAGGLAEQTPGQKIYVLRQSDGQELRITVDADLLLTEADMTQNLGVRPGDIIMVPRSAQSRVFVSGEVARPGPIPFSAGEGITVLQAITAAGGPTNRAKQSRIFIIRRGSDGAQTTMIVNLKRIRRGQDPDLPLEANDTISVPTSFL